MNLKKPCQPTETKRLFQKKTGKAALFSCYTAATSQANSSIGRAPVSKTGGWGFDSLLACHVESTSLYLLLFLPSLIRHHRLKFEHAQFLERFPYRYQTTA